MSEEGFSGIKWCTEVKAQPIVFGIRGSATLRPQLWTDCSLLLCFVKWGVVGGSLKHTVVIPMVSMNLHPLYTFMCSV